MALSIAKLLLRTVFILGFPILIYRSPFHEFLILFLVAIALVCLLFCIGMFGSQSLDKTRNGLLCIVWGDRLSLP